MDGSVGERESELLWMERERERDGRGEIPCLLTPTPFFSRCIPALVAHSAVVRLQKAASDAEISSLSLSYKDLFSLWTAVTYRGTNYEPVSRSFFRSES